MDLFASATFEIREPRYYQLPLTRSPVDYFGLTVP
jgi:hypothetical protein